MPAAPKISVLLPVHNGGALLLRAARSILAQSCADFELLIIDDGSTDDSIAALRAIADPRLRVIGDATQRGLAARLNQGIDAAQGAVIARMDGDDIAFPTRLEKQLAFLDAHPDIDLVGCRAVIFRDSPNGKIAVIGLHPFAATHDALCARPWRGIPLPHPTWMGRTTWFRDFRYALPDTLRAEDQELLLRSYSLSRFACVEDVLLGYRQTDFDLRKTFIARRSLLAAQLRLFGRRRQIGNIILALTASAVKIMIDLTASLPGCGRLFFARMAAPVPDDVMRALDRARAGAAS